MLHLLAESLVATASTMSIVFIMLFLTGLMNELGLFYKISYLAKPLISFSHLPAVSASTFVVSLGSALAANTMIARMKDEGSLTECQAFFCAIMNSVPVYFRELFTYHLAFVVPVLGIFAGGIYAIVALSTGIIKLLIVMILGRAYLPGESDPSQEVDLPEDKKSISQAALRSLRGQGRLFLRIASLFFVMTFLVLYLSERGILQSINALPIAHLFGVPPETIVPLTIYVASPKAGITLLGPMISNGSISEAKALIVLMLGSMFMLPFYSIRSLMPNYTSVFGMRLGLSLVVISTGISVLVRLMVLIVLMVLAG
ncbi:nucleoside recognition protein [Methanothrix soehngenii]|uniref:nucleoside recognition protein n=1 Tax=Methanothrix soehngenii TaxID=2223 RepID=UPI002B9CB6D3|nr:nucleoside recognition protein [Methanothrix soehngenii]HPY93240.1 nucleoside recognition protein [Methanothrix soehngenii]